MNYTEKYKGYGWIKVPKFTPDPYGCEGELIDHFREFEKHHIKETQFLIAEIRKLAKKLDEK